MSQVSSLKTKDVQPLKIWRFTKGNDDFNQQFLGVIFSTYIGLCGCWCKHFKSVLGIITWWKAVMLMGMSWWLLPYIGEMFINIWFSLHMNKGWWFAFLSNVARFVHLPKTEFLTSAPGDDFLVARCDVGRGITAIALPGTELPKFHDWFRWGLRFIDSYDRLTRIPKCWISWVSLILESQHETAIGWGLG